MKKLVFGAVLSQYGHVWGLDFWQGSSASNGSDAIARYMLQCAARLCWPQGFKQLRAIPKGPRLAQPSSRWRRVVGQSRADFGECVRVFDNAIAEAIEQQVDDFDSANFDAKESVAPIFAETLF